MSWQDRPYAGDSPGPELRIQWRKPSSAVTWLIIVNVVVFLLDLFSQRFAGPLAHSLFGLSLSGIKSLYLWQPLTYMFMHKGLYHLLANMLGLYIFGSEFERAFGRERFLQFYAVCGLIGGFAYLLLGAIFPADFYSSPVVGASGAIYGLLVAAIIFFPHIRVVLVIFPMPIRVFGLIVLAILVVALMTPGGMDNPGGEACHVAGAIAGIGVFYAWGIMPRIRLGGGKGITVLPGAEDLPFRRRSEGAWARKQKAMAEEQLEVDRILEKVHREGLQSLSRKEKKILARATERQRKREQEINHL